MIIRFLIYCSVILTPLLSQAQEWKCKNDVEVQCEQSKCSVMAEEHTPMEVTFSDSGKISACAYTGCWEGLGTVSKNSSFLILSVKKAKWVTPIKTKRKNDLIFILDKTDNIGFIKVNTFAQPLLCKKI